MNTKSLRIATVFGVFFLLQTSVAQTTRNSWDAADSLIVRLQPSAFRILPAAVVRYLEASGYTIPQCRCDTTPNNVVTGRFSDDGTTGWAVLASKKRISTILIFMHASDTTPARVGEMADRSFLQSLGNAAVGFSRLIRIVGKASREKVNRQRATPASTLFHHDGIEDSFVEKGSVRYYFDKGTWTSLPGED